MIEPKDYGSRRMVESSGICLKKKKITTAKLVADFLIKLYLKERLWF